jgi:hypothetical protein
MSTNRQRVRFVVLATVWFVILSSSLQPSVPGSLQGDPEAPTLEELTLLGELIDWVDGPVGDSGVLARVRRNPGSFELLRSFPPEESRRQVLQALPFGRLIAGAADRWNLDPLLLAALVEAESSFCPAVTSPRGAVGLAQVLPTTAQIYGVSDLTDPATNLEVAAQYLARLMNRFDDDLGLVLAAYNAGPTNVARYGGVPPFRETRHYVEKVLTRYVEHQQEAWVLSGASQLLIVR